MGNCDQYMELFVPQEQFALLRSVIPKELLMYVKINVGMIKTDWNKNVLHEN